MALPKAIQKQVDEAAQIEAVLAGEGTLDENTPENAVEDDKAAPPVVDDKAPAKPDDQQIEAPAGDKEWQDKYKVLEGKYRSEVPRLHQEVRKANEAVAALQAQVDALTKAKDTPPPAKPDPLVTPKDQDAFGDDLIDLARRVTREETSEINQRLDALTRAIANIASLPKQVGEIVEKQALTEEQVFWKDLGTAIPDWDVVDNDPAWIAHLDSKAKYVNATHRDLAALAIQARDVSAIVELVNDWKALSGYKAVDETKLKNQKELERQITPNKATGNPPPPAEVKTYTWAEYDAAFDPRASRTMSSAEIDALQAEMEKALLEGRIV